MEGCNRKSINTKLNLDRTKVFMVGAGPSTIDYLTLKAYKLISIADVIVHDYLVDASILQLAKKEALIFNCESLGKSSSKGTKANSQTKINDLLVKHAKAGKTVVRLKNGDPSIFGRLNEEIAALNENKIPFEIIPGVTAACAAACVSKISLTHRETNSSVVFVSGHKSSRSPVILNWDALSKSGTTVLYMSVSTITIVARNLIAAGKDKNTSVIVVSKAGSKEQKIIRGKLQNIDEKVRSNNIKSPAIFLVSDHARNVKNKLTINTGTLNDPGLNNNIHIPLVKIEPLNDYRHFDKIISALKSFDWLVFTSRHGVKFFFERLNAVGADVRSLNKVKIAVIGQATRKYLRGFGISADVIAKEESSEGLLKALEHADINDKKILIPRSDKSRDVLVKGLRDMGAKINAPIAYKNSMAKDLPDLEFDRIEKIIFTSPSGVRYFLKRYGLPPKHINIHCIGPITEAEAQKHRLLS